MRKAEILFLAALCGLLVLGACGRKAPPRMPGKSLPLRVVELEAQWEGGTLTLSGRVVPYRAITQETWEVTGCRVYHARYGRDTPPCDDCPINYTGYRELERKVLSRDRFQCSLSMEPSRGIHYFQVRLTGPKGALGPASDRARVIQE
jgi:hypothetical protein